MCSLVRIVNEHTPYWALQCQHTYWVESLNYQLLTYIPTHIYFGSIIYMIVTVHCIVLYTRMKMRVEPAQVSILSRM